jgi:hypothetical protein
MMASLPCLLSILQLAEFPGQRLFSLSGNSY